MAAQEVVRRCANYKPSVWTDDHIQSLSSKYKDEVYIKRNRELKEDVRGILCKLIDPVEQLEMIDVLQRLGVGYHFNNEIRNILDTVHSKIDTLKRKESLHAIAITFRLLRQHGFNISADIFISFKDKMGDMKESLFDDVDGLLSLYEASFYSFDNEPILDEARDFTKKILKEFVASNGNSDTSILINHALEFPLHWTVPRMETLWFINFQYHKRRSESDHVLIQFAELDFNILQSIHQEELKNVSRWWKNIGLVDELGFFRDRLVENFIWALDMNFKPEIGNFREVITKVNSFLTIFDDLYDVYGTLEELELFTEAIESWDLNYLDGLPHYMKLCFLALYNFVNEVSFASLKENGYNTIPYLKKAWVDLCKSYFSEAKWYYNGYTPRLQEYMDNAWISIAVHVGLTHALFLTPTPLKREDLVLLEDYPNIIRYSSTIGRLADDLGTLKREMETGDVSKATQCYMNETGASEAESRDYLRSMMLKVWKKVNEEALNSSLSENFIYTTTNIGRAALLFYQHGDGFSISHHETKNRIQSLIMEPLSIISK